jgi:hypothetical protein
MRIDEVAGAATESGRLAALAQFLVGRAKDESASKKISTSTFLSLAQSMGISISENQLRDLAQQPPLSGLIANVENDEILFRGEDQVSNAEMSVDQARDAVDSMAKRAAKKAI